MIDNLLVLFPLSDAHKNELKGLLPGTNIVFSSVVNFSKEDLEHADVVFGNLPPEEIKHAANLKWLHLSSAGTDGYMPAALCGLTLTNGTGAYDVVLPEHMLALLFAVNAHIGEYRDNQRNHVWKRLDWSSYISGSTCLMLGAGNIGCGFLQRMKALGAHTIGVRRTGRSKPDYVDEMYSMEDIDSLLPIADIVAMALPGTPETINIMDERRISLMKKGACLINAGRGNAIDPKALYNALLSGHLSGAGIDVAYNEPLEEDSFLWDAPNLIITPHVAGGWNLNNNTTSPFMEQTVFEVFKNNLTDYLSGNTLRNSVDLKTGYRTTQK